MIKDAGWASLYIKEHGSIVFLGAPYRCGTLTHDNHDYWAVVELKPRACGLTGHREGCKCDRKAKVSNG